jgi:thiosulfate dehydrogenase
MIKILKSNWFIVILFFVIASVIVHYMISHEKHPTDISQEPTDSTWVAPSLYTDQETEGKERQMVMYGEELIAHTGIYFGPEGSVRQISNGMNCQNCHLDAGTRPWGNNYGAVYSTYPKFRARSGTVEDIYKRVNDCFERSLNGKSIDTGSREMQAIYAYMKWLGRDVPKGKKPYSTGLPVLPYMNRAADPEKGKSVYINYCQSCHGQNGEGILNVDKKSYQYPPLWGDHSYNDGAGLYRITRFASYVKSNMPFNQATHEMPKLSDEEAWDVAAFVNSQPRPHRDQSGDWKDFTKKSIDEPFGPYDDGFSEKQHKYGPYPPIEAAARKKLSAKTNPMINKN